MSQAFIIYDFDGDSYLPVNAKLECVYDNDGVALFHSREAAQRVIDSALAKAKHQHRSRPWLAIWAGEFVEVTKTGKILTEADFEALADEAEKGYDVSHLHK